MIEESRKFVYIHKLLKSVSSFAFSVVYRNPPVLKELVRVYKYWEKLVFIMRLELMKYSLDISPSNFRIY